MITATPPDSDRWIFVTGMIRSGTTFVGRVLSLPFEVDYLHEPFNGGRSLPDGKPFVPRYVRPGVTGPEVNEYRSHLAKIFSYDLTLPTVRDENDSWFRKMVKTVVKSRGPACLRLAKMNPLDGTTVLKDPVGKLTAEFLYREFGVRPVIVVRHPASLAASLKRVEWWPEMKDFHQEPELLEDYFRDEEAFLGTEWPSRLHEAMAHWRATHKALLSQAATYDDWLVLTHEELSERPVETFGQLYERLDLRWTSSIERNIRALTGGSNTVEARDNRVMDLSRDSASIFELRRDSLDPTERREIYDIVGDVALKLYSRESFALPDA